MYISQASGAEAWSGSSLSTFSLTDQQFETKVKKYLGIPYRKGGTSKKGMDCSSFVRTVYNSFFGVKLPYTARAQFDFSEFKKINPHEIQPGDLIFFANNRKKRVNHVGMYMSDGKFIHASSSQGITISSLDNHYWKKRFVGSKRFTKFNTEPDSHEFRFESFLELPVHENGEIQAYSFNSLAMENDLKPFDDTFFKSYDLNNSSLYFYEIGYGHTMFNGFDISLSAIHEKFELSATWPIYMLDDSLSDTAERRGLKMTSDFRPINWLSITPSITYFDYSKENQDILNAPEWSFGLNTHVTPVSNQWSLSMLLQYSEGEELAINTSPYSRFSSMDMEIKLWINLTDSLQFSITGQHDMQKTAEATREDPLFMPSTGSNVLMMFHCQY